MEAFVDAWSIWLTGSEVDKDLLICGMSLRWWGRIGKALQLVGAFTLMLELIGARRLAAFDTWATEKAFPYVTRLYARFAVVVLKGILPIVRKTEDLQRFSVALRVSVFTALTIAAIYAVASGIAGRDTGREVVELLFAALRIAWEVVILYMQALLVLSVGVQLALLVPTLFTMVVARILNHRHSKKVLTAVSILAIVVGVFFDELTS